MSISPLVSIVPCFSLHLGHVHLSVIMLSASPFVLTATLRKSYEVALMAVGQKWPVLLYGPVGAGKTALINKLAQIVGNRGIYDICL
jgi:midasin (ATPase involved in ribosome maturation)